MVSIIQSNTDFILDNSFTLTITKIRLMREKGPGLGKDEIVKKSIAYIQNINHNLCMLHALVVGEYHLTFKSSVSADVRKN